MAVTRTSLDGSASMNPEECMSVEQALESYTNKGAEAFFVADRFGSIKEGNYADFVVLDQDLTRVPAESIHKTKVLMTVMNGETVFER
jgi:predicted amidohydrolase YtcJ